MDEPLALMSMDLADLQALMEGWREPAFRAKQVYGWLARGARPEEMTNLSKTLRQRLGELPYGGAAIYDKRVSQRDGTIKYLLEFADGNCVETVLMRFDNRANLTRDTGLKVTNIVFMGQGEPLLNLDNVLKAIDIFNTDFVICIRRLTVSTCGIIPQINKLAAMDFQPTLAVSLHAPTHELRQSLMPVENRYPIDELMQTLKDYVGETGRRVTIEYTLIKDFNDTVDCAKKLAVLLIGLKANINLIIYNPNDKDNFEKPGKESIQKFKYILEQSGKKVTIRLERGSDIDAACGQLSNKMKD